MAEKSDGSFRTLAPQIDLPSVEQDILKFWEKNNIFEKSVSARDGAPRWTFYEGPPTANGSPGTHHIEARVFKDLFPRYQTMKGHQVLRKAGLDCHGLPVEIAVEKELGFSGKGDIEKYGIAAKAWAVFTLTWNGQSLIYSGQELPNHKRLAFFEKDEIQWTSVTPLLHDFYKTLLTARKQFPVLAAGSIFNLSTDNAVMAYLKEAQGQTALVILNLSPERHQVHIVHDAFNGKFTNLFSRLNFEFNGDSQFELMPGEYIVYLKERI